MIRSFTLFLLLGLLLPSCGSIKLKDHVFPEPVDTSSKEINYQEKTSYRFDGVYVDNMFDGARMNGFQQINDTTFRVIVSPENTPINSSAYFGFRIQSEKPRSIDLEIEYTHHEHRYIPKLSYDGVNWTAMDSTQFDTLKSPKLATLRLDVDKRKLFVCGQELQTSTHAKEWSLNLTKNNSFVKQSVAGQSTLDRDILFLDIDQFSKKDKEAVVIFSRLHPPEVSGYIAMQAYVEELLRDTPLSNLFRKRYRILVYPMINPDGVDLGHWRHGPGGIDLNRDWAYYRQKETKTVAEHCLKEVKRLNNKVTVGLDFHSTQKDIYYTLTPNRKSSVFGFKDIWLQGIDDAFPNYEPLDGPNDLNKPITKGWFYLQFGAEGITYEVGDETPRSFVKDKAAVAAREMMKLLVLR